MRKAIAVVTGLLIMAGWTVAAQEKAKTAKDEPKAKSGHETMRLLRQIAKEEGRSVVIVSHDERIKDIADRVLWLEDGQFKSMVTMTIDPGCRMAVDREQAVSAERDGATYYFCSRGCRSEFGQGDELPRQKSAAPY